MARLQVPDLGAYLREQREAAELSLRQLSELAGVSNPYLSQIERGLRRPSAEILNALAKGLQISAESLYVRAGLLDEPLDDPLPEPVDEPPGEGASPAPPVAASATTSPTTSVTAASAPARSHPATGGCRPAPDVVAAIEADPALTPRRRRVLVDLYHQLAEAPEGDLSSRTTSTTTPRSTS